MAEKRLIDANALLELVANDLWAYEVEQFEHYVSKTPTVDAVEVVRCKDCKKGRPIDMKRSPEKYFGSNCVVCECERVVGDEPMVYEPTHFCSYGERRTDG